MLRTEIFPQRTDFVLEGFDSAFESPSLVVPSTSGVASLTSRRRSLYAKRVWLELKRSGGETWSDRPSVLPVVYSRKNRNPKKSSPELTALTQAPGPLSRVP